MIERYDYNPLFLLPSRFALSLIDVSLTFIAQYIQPFDI